ncbi:efflux RND transporter periplasmic adaptor subunit [Azotobacter chroococcum]|uniref:efflux RND transporter periplasmic adaptor subunit n=1 Tax=Azotobacter chroococcum TaxID=353 RepID=UPI003D32BCA3
MRRAPPAHRADLPDHDMTYLRWTLLLTLLGCVLALTGWQSLAPPVRVYDAVPVERGDIESGITAPGTLQPRHYRDVVAQTAGQLLRLHVEVGDSVREGQLLAEIDPADQQAAVDASRVQLESLGALREEQLAQRDLARQQYERQRTLARSGAARQEDVQTTHAELRVAEARLKSTDVQLRQAQASLRSEEAALAHTRLHSPLDGTVIAVGQTLDVQKRTPLIRIAQLTSMTVHAQVPEADISRVRPGMPAWFSTLGGGGRRWPARVRQILPVPPRPLEQLGPDAGDPPGGEQETGQGRGVLYSVLLDVDNEDQALMAEMTAQVFFVASRVRGALTAPLAALQESTDRPDVHRVQVLRQDGEPAPREVRTGIRDQRRVEVLEGLAEGERLLVNGANRQEP